MTGVYILMLVIAIMLAAAFTLRRAVKTDGLAMVLKTAASLAFIMLGFTAFRGAVGARTIYLLPGLVFGLVGDIYLDLKYVHKDNETMYTFTGFAAFILGHMCYFVFMLRQYGTLSTGLIVSIIVGVLAGIGIFLTPTLMNLDYGRFRLISAAYAALLVFVTVYALCLCIDSFSIAKIMFLAGIVLFLFSDLVLSQIYFGEDKNTSVYIIVNHGSYYLGQILIAASLFFL